MPDIMEVIVKGLCVGQAIYNVLHFRDENDQGPAGLISEMGGASPNWFTTLMACLCADYSLSSFLTRSDIDTTPGPQIETAVGPFTGSSGGTAAALPSSAVIKWVTAAGGRSGRGRTYIGPPSAAHVVDGLLHADLNAAVTAFRNQMQNRFFLTGSSYQGNYTFGIWSPTLSLFRPATAGVPRLEAKTQRRRQLGVGI